MQMSFWGRSGLETNVYEWDVQEKHEFNILNVLIGFEPMSGLRIKVNSLLAHIFFPLIYCSPTTVQN